MLDSVVDNGLNVLDMEVLGENIYYILHDDFSDQVRNDKTSADLFYSAIINFGSVFEDMVFLHHSLQPGK